MRKETPDPGRGGIGPDRLIVFGRYPVPGRTKTRLIPFLGPVGAAELQRYLMERTFCTARSVASRSCTALEICFEGGSAAKMRRWLGPGAAYSVQSCGDLGQRMENAFREAFDQGCRRVVLFGTDIPQLSAPILFQAMERLQDQDLVLGPSNDGGYWLIGLKKNADLFMGISWGSEQVLAQTLAKARRQALSASLLDPLTDVDTIEDVHRLLPDWEDNRPYLSVIIPALDEAEHIKEAVRHALCRDAEVMVVDGGSRDKTREAAAHAGAGVLESPKGRGPQQNHGAEAAGGRVLLFLHADTLLPEDYANHIFETLLERKAVLGAFRFKTDLKKPLARVVEALVNFRSRYLCLPYGDQALFLRKEVFQKTSGFPNVPIGEDFFFVKRLRRHGRIALANAFVTTSGRRWERRGLLRTTWTNQVVLAGLAMGISLSTLASVYGPKGLRRRRQYEPRKQPQEGRT